MINKLLPVALALFSLLGSPLALAWYKEGGNPVFTATEINHCKSMALEAGEVMVARQANELPTFHQDKYGPPSEATIVIRKHLSRIALAYPVAGTEEERKTDVTDFMNSTNAMCINVYIDSVPESPRPQ